MTLINDLQMGIVMPSVNLKLFNTILDDIRFPK